jgi:hypothetical protein
MVGALRFKGKSYEEIAAELKFDSVEEMRNRLECLQLPGWFVGAETSSDKKRVREKSTPACGKLVPPKIFRPPVTLRNTSRSDSRLSSKTI